MHKVRGYYFIDRAEFDSPEVDDEVLVKKQIRMLELEIFQMYLSNMQIITTFMKILNKNINFSNLLF